MIKEWAIFAGMFCLFLLPFVPGASGNRVVNLGGGGGGAPTYLIAQTYNGTGYDNGETWSEVNNPNEDYATSPAPLEGSHSWFSNSGTATATSPTFTSPPTTCYAYFLLNISVGSPSANTEIFRFLNAGEVASLQLRTSGLLRIEHNNNNTVNAFTPTAGTSYHVWYDYTPATGGGGNGVLNLYHAEDSGGSATKPGSPTATLTNGTNTAMPNQVYHAGGTGSGVIIDKTLVSASPIGSNP